MFILRWLCRVLPAMRPLFVGIGYVMLIIAGEIWFICFPLTAYTLYEANQFPFDYFAVPVSLPFPLSFFLPADIQPALIPVCLGFTLYGLFIFYFNVRNLRKLRRGEN